ncbi:MAG: sigma-70 family RNA polymerase sigma factor [Acidobacteriota bacterium]|nr:MAG: sigma-70 family RNA polymerase sigma factor [Acidobacteriota bacterium]
MAELTRTIASEAFADRDELVVRLKEGDESAFDEVFQLYKDMVYTLALKLLADKGESMDVTQEVFLTLFRKIHSFRGECSLKTWLYRVAINQAANRNRWWKRHLQSRTVSLSISNEPDRPAVRELPSNQPSPLRDCYSAELRKALEKTLSELPFEQRVTITLRDVEGLAYEEIAEVTSTSIGTVKSRIARARIRLRDQLQKFKGGEEL